MTGMMQMLIGVGGKISVNLIGYSVSLFGINPTTQTAGYRITTAGVEQRTVTSNSYSGTTEIIDPISLLSDYEVRMTLNSNTGLSPSGNFNTWIQLGVSTLTWAKTSNTLGIVRSTMTIEIRKIGTTEILDTASITLEITIEA